MKITAQIAKNLREVHFGGNWCFVALREQVENLTWQQATQQPNGFHSIAELVFHINYYVEAVAGVLEGKPLTAKDKFSFDLSPIKSAKDWEMLLAKSWNDVEHFAKLIENLNDSQLFDTFSDEKYGNLHRNLIGTIEHTHYHLGQIVLIKKMITNLEN